MLKSGDFKKEKRRIPTPSEYLLEKTGVDSFFLEILDFLESQAFECLGNGVGLPFKFVLSSEYERDFISPLGLLASRFFEKGWFLNWNFKHGENSQIIVEFTIDFLRNKFIEHIENFDN